MKERERVRERERERDYARGKRGHHDPVQVESASSQMGMREGRDGAREGREERERAVDEKGE